MSRQSIVYLFLICFLFVSSHLAAKIKLPRLVSDGMVLQRDAKIKIWGWADPGEKIKVQFKGKAYSATTDKDGQWQILLNPQKAGGPFAMKISGNTDNLTINDILVGDVWLCAGQSNMVHYMDGHDERYAKDIAEANNTKIRQFLVPTNAVLTGPSEDLPQGEWKTATRDNIGRFSVVAYFFAKKLYEKYNIPMGLINASVGGTPIEAWTSEEGLKDFPDMQKRIERNKDTAYVNNVNRKAFEARRSAPNPADNDLGMKGDIPWYDVNYDAGQWRTINVPGYWEDQGLGELNGIVWYRKEVNIPASMTGKAGRIKVGRIVDADNVYINGVHVGNKTYQYPQRRYDIPADLLKEGKNIVVVKVANYNGKGGFVPDKPYFIATENDTVDIKGTWQYKVGVAFPKNRRFVGGISAQNQPTSLYNGMVAPYTNYEIKGALWYQGESNAGRPVQYEKLMPALIKDWRTLWNNPELPVFIAQLPGFMDIDFYPTESNWARLRESQRKALELPNTALAVTLDLGEWNDIHPDNKKPIGDRMALAAENMVYGDKEVVYSGPMYRSSTLNGHQVTLEFDHTGSGIVSSDGEDLRWFAIAGDDKEFVWAETKIENNKVIVWSDEVKYPVFVRYAWSNNPDQINFYNQEGLPASPFEAAVIDINQGWFGKKAAVVLTYDDALDVHLDNAIPILDSLGLKGSFYLSANFPGSKDRLRDWKRAAENGHELGNHTLFHPCDASKDGRSWVNEDNDLSKYSTNQIVREIQMTNVFLEALDGKKERTFAYTCGDVSTGEGSFIDAIENEFVAMRGVVSELNTTENMNLKNINCYVIDNNNAGKLIEWAEKAKEENALMVVLFHGVGGGHNIDTDQKAHDDFLKYLKDNEGDIWVPTMIDAAKYFKSQKGI